MTVDESIPALLQINLFGPMQVLVHGQPLPRLRSRKAQWLFALLILHYNRPVSREWLAGTLWPDVNQSQAFANLRPIVSELRQALGDESQRLQSPNRHTLFLDLTEAQIDLLAFDAALASRKPSAWEQALSLYQGPLLEGCTEEWVAQERSEREQNCLEALHKLGDIALASGEYDTAIGHYQRAAGIAPLWEIAQRGWMEALAKRGDINAALQVYRDFVEQLKVDPKATPDPKTTALYSQLRNDARQKASLSSPVPEAPITTVTSHLPRPLTELIGREDERSEIIAKLKRHRLVTLTGVGGIGKTRLAIEVATHLTGEFVDGVWMIPLETIQEEKQITSQIASLLEIKEVADRGVLQSITAHLKRKRLLLILDNCEHLLTALAPLVSHLLQECILIRILATSREPLSIVGENTWAVPALAVPDPDHLPSGVSTLQRVLPGYESVLLFLERAQSVQKSFRLHASNARTIAKICYQLEGIPLAIELAAARVRALSVEQICERLQDYLTFLTGGSRLALSRQQTLRGTLDWSYGLLSDSEKVLLSRLSVFVGGWTLEAAEGICSDETLGVSQITELLGSLVDKSLVVFSEEKLGERYRLLEMVRQYAFERLKENDQVETIRIRHRDWFLLFASRTNLALQHDLQERDYDNLRAVLANCASRQASEEEADIALKLVGSLRKFWFVRGFFSEGRKYMMRALAAEGAQTYTRERANALNGAGSLAEYQGDFVTARALIQESLNIHQEIGYFKGAGFSLNRLASVEYAQGDYISAGKHYEEALVLFKELEYGAGVSWTLSGLSNVACILGNYERAEALVTESLAMARAAEDSHEVATLTSRLGSIKYEQGDYIPARTLHEESLRLFQEIGLKSGLAWTTNNLGMILNEFDDPTAARALHEESLKLFQAMEERPGIAASLASHGYTEYRLGNYARAESLYRESMAVFQELKDQLGVIDCLDGLAMVLLARTEYREAAKLWGNVESLRERVGYPMQPRRRPIYKGQLENLHQALDTEAFAEAWNEGRAQVIYG